MVRVAVWGASGFIGGHIAASLSGRGHYVRGLTRHSATSAPRMACSETRVLDFSASMDSLCRALEGMACAIYCAGLTHSGDDDQREYVASVRNMANASASCGLDRFILLSSVAVYGSRPVGPVGVEAELNPDTPYGRSRKLAEDMAREALSASNTSLTIFRVPAVVGADMRSDVLRRVFRSLRSGVFLHPGSSESVFPCVGVNRLATCVAVVAEAKTSPVPPVVQLCDCFRWTDLTKQCASQTGRGHIRIGLPGKAVRLLCRILGLDLARSIAVLDGRVCYEDNSGVLTMKNQFPDTLEDIRELIGQQGLSVK